MITVLGLFAGALTTLSFLPQVLHTVRTRSAGDLSWAWLLLFGAGVASWVVFGSLTRDLPIVMANGITFALIGALAALKVGQEVRTRRGAEQHA
ncbi:MAG TPA: SemiSWEET transporter [Pseudonocardiaceae bacterium]|jgi:MtN3 and saliva related transmembrane protein|nr:SemiSWEET transporter [Pseudonocardiaceae bacterium]